VAGAGGEVATIGAERQRIGVASVIREAAAFLAGRQLPYLDAAPAAACEESAIRAHGNPDITRETVHRADLLVAFIIPYLHATMSVPAKQQPTGGRKRQGLIAVERQGQLFDHLVDAHVPYLAGVLTSDK